MGSGEVKVVAINDLAPPKTNAHLFRYDSVHGRFPGRVQLEGDVMDVGQGPIKVLAERDMAKLPLGRPGHRPGARMHRRLHRARRRPPAISPRARRRC